MATLAIDAAPSGAQQAAAPWPVSAQGRPLPRPAWILVIPARRKPNGDLVIWQRDDAWTKAWRVPRLVGGIRMVTLLGDSEDRRAITADAIDNMLVASLDVVIRKYGAPAVALAVTDGRSVALAGYAPGWSASWQPVDAAADVDETRRRSASTLAGMFNGSQSQPSQPAAQPDAPADASFDTQVVDAIARNDGTFDYVVSFTVPGQAAEEIRTRLESMPGARVTSSSGPAGRVRAVLSYDRPHDGIADDLGLLGFLVR